jgi:hypothetical protein
MLTGYAYSLGTGQVSSLPSDWPSAFGGYILRGGSWLSLCFDNLAYPFRDIAISDRFYKNQNLDARRSTTGLRGAL